MNRSERLAALNGERRTFVCHSCGKVKHVKDAGARVGRSAGLVCGRCIAVPGLRDYQVALRDDLRESFMQARVKSYPHKVVIISTPTVPHSNLNQVFKEALRWVQNPT